ncbi:MAG: hypothetical protein WC374_10525 [Phycisphaerae bacterium]|jgi:hypothetical protein
MEPPSKKTIIQALSLARDLADKVWEDHCQGLKIKKEGYKRCLAYIDEKRQRNLTYDPEGRLDNFCFYLGQFDYANQYRFIEKIAEQKPGEVKCLLEVVCLAYYSDFDREIELLQK